MLADWARNAALLDDLWSSLGEDQWGVTVTEPPENPDLGPVPLARLALARLTEVDVHGVDLDVGFPDWSPTLVDVAPPDQACLAAVSPLEPPRRRSLAARQLAVGRGRLQVDRVGRRRSGPLRPGRPHRGSRPSDDQRYPARPPRPAPGATTTATARDRRRPRLRRRLRAGVSRALTRPRSAELTHVRRGALLDTVRGGAGRAGARRPRAPSAPVRRTRL